MKINFVSITFWFNIFENHQEILTSLNESLANEYSNFNVLNGNSSNLFTPVVTAVNEEKKTSMAFSKINFQYNIEGIQMKDFAFFKEKALNIFEFFEKNQIEILHTAIFVNGETICDNAFDKISKHTINESLVSDDLIDMTLKLGKKQEDLFYKIVSILNKKQLKLPQKIDEKGRLIPVPLISWYNAETEAELFEISYEINDKYSFDYTKNYHTTEFYLNKMLYLLENELEKDVTNIIEKGTF